MTRSAPAVAANSSSPAASPIAGSDAALSEEEGELKTAMERCEPGRTGRDPGLRLADRGHLQPRRKSNRCSSRPHTLAKIFNQKITNWNDPAIAKENPGVELPDTRITPVNRSDESGTTENFTDYLSQGRPERLDRTK